MRMRTNDHRHPEPGGLQDVVPASILQTSADERARSQLIQTSQFSDRVQQEDSSAYRRCFQISYGSTPDSQRHSLSYGSNFVEALRPARREDQDGVWKITK